MVVVWGSVVVVVWGSVVVVVWGSVVVVWGSVEVVWGSVVVGGGKLSLPLIISCEKEKKIYIFLLTIPMAECPAT